MHVNQIALVHKSTFNISRDKVFLVAVSILKLTSTDWVHYLVLPSYFTFGGKVSQIN